MANIIEKEIVQQIEVMKSKFIAYLIPLAFIIVGHRLPCFRLHSDQDFVVHVDGHVNEPEPKLIYRITRRECRLSSAKRLMREASYRTAIL